MKIVPHCCVRKFVTGALEHALIHFPIFLHMQPWDGSSSAMYDSVTSLAGMWYADGDEKTPNNKTPDELHVGEEHHDDARGKLPSHGEGFEHLVHQEEDAQ